MNKSTFQRKNKKANMWNYWRTFLFLNSHGELLNFEEEVTSVLITHSCNSVPIASSDIADFLTTAVCGSLKDVLTWEGHHQPFF